MSWIKSIACQTWEAASEPFHRVKNFKKNFAALILAYLVGLSALLRAGVCYGDDWARKIWGYQGFGFSRYLSDFMSTLINTGTHLTDISPLTQLIAVVFVSMAGMILLLVLTDKEKFTLWDIAAALPLGLSPYFLQCLTFKFDSPYMALSILVSVAPLLLYKAPTVVYLLGVGLGTMAMCTTYQAASGIFPMAVIFLCWKLWMDNEDGKQGDMKIILFAVKSALAYAAALVIFRTFFMIPFDDFGYTGTQMYDLRHLPGGVLRNFKQFYKFVLTDYENFWLLCIAVIFAVFPICSALTARRNKLAALAVSGAVLIGSGVLAFGVYLALVKPVFDCRAMYGFGVLISLAAIAGGSRKYSLPGKAACLILSWCFVVFAVTYGNAIQEQQRYVDDRINLVLSDLNHVEAMEEENVKMQLSGNIGYSPVVEEMLKYSKMLNRMWYPGFAGETQLWHDFHFFHYYDLNAEEVTDLLDAGLPLTTAGYYHDIYSEENTILVVLKER